MSRANVGIVQAASLLLSVLVQRSSAEVETVPLSPIPPPPGELVLSYPNSSLPNPSNTRLRFSGPVTSNSSSPTTVTMRYNWTLPSGDLAFSSPVTYVLDPG